MRYLWDIVDSLNDASDSTNLSLYHIFDSVAAWPCPNWPSCFGTNELHDQYTAVNWNNLNPIRECQPNDEGHGWDFRNNMLNNYRVRRAGPILQQLHGVFLIRKRCRTSAPHLAAALFVVGIGGCNSDSGASGAGTDSGGSSDASSTGGEAGRICDGSQDLRMVVGQTSPTAVVNAWMNSDGHCANIMNKNFKELGVGYYQGGGQYKRYWTQNFGAR